MNSIKSTPSQQSTGYLMNAVYLVGVQEMAEQESEGVTTGRFLVLGKMGR